MPLQNYRITTCQHGEVKSSLATFSAAVLEALFRLILRWQTGQVTLDLFIAASKQAVPKPQSGDATAPVLLLQ